MFTTGAAGGAGGGAGAGSGFGMMVGPFSAARAAAGATGPISNKLRVLGASGTACKRLSRSKRRVGSTSPRVASTGRMRRAPRSLPAKLLVTRRVVFARGLAGGGASGTEGTAERLWEAVGAEGTSSELKLYQNKVPASRINPPTRILGSSPTRTPKTFVPGLALTADLLLRVLHRPGRRPENEWKY